MTLEDDLLEVLRQSETPMRGYQVGNVLDDRYEAQGLRERFLFWTFPKMVPFGTLYRALDRLVDRGLIERRRDGDRPIYWYSAR